MIAPSQCVAHAARVHHQRRRRRQTERSKAHPRQSDIHAAQTAAEAAGPARSPVTEKVVVNAGHAVGAAASLKTRAAVGAGKQTAGEVGGAGATWRGGGRGGTRRVSHNVIRLVCLAKLHTRITNGHPRCRCLVLDWITLPGLVRSLLGGTKDVHSR